MALFPVAIITLFMTRELGFSMAEVFGLQAWFGLCTALLEFPGGLVADRAGYKRSMVLAALLGIVGWVIYASAASLYTVAAAELVMAASLALTSGTDSALMYESLKELGREVEFTQWFGRSRSLGAVAEGSAALAAGLLYAHSPRSPFWLQVVVWVGALLVSLPLIEPRREIGTDKHPFRRTRAVVRYAVLRQPRLRASLWCYVALGLGSFIPVWMIAPYAEEGGLPVPWIGVMWAAANYSVALGSFVSAQLEQRLGPVAALRVVIACYLVGYLGLGASYGMFGFAFYYAICLGRGLNGPILNHLQQALIPSSDRAALLSLNSLLFRAGFAVLGPVIGWGVDAYGHHMVFLSVAATLLPFCVLSVGWLNAAEAAPVPSSLEPTGKRSPEVGQRSAAL